MSKTSEIRQQTWAAPLAANATYLVSAHTLDGTTLATVANQPDFPRVLTLVASGATTANVTITGTDILGGTVTETVALAGTTSVTTVHAFATVTSIVLPTVAATVNIGIDTALGLDSYCDENSFDDLADASKKAHQQTWAAPAAASTTAVLAARSEAVVFLQYLYSFTVTAANATAAAVYSNNGNNFTVVATIAGGTTLILTSASSVAPQSSGTLTKVSGTGDATIAFSAHGSNLVTQPDFPRIITIVGAGSGHSATGNVVINGTDILGATISDTITLNSNTTVKGVKAFKTVTSIDTTGISANDANNTVAIGIAADLGLDSYCDAYSFMGFSAETSFTNSATVISQNTVITTTAPNGSANIGVVFMPLQFPTSVGVKSYTSSTTVVSLNTVTLRGILDGVTDQDIIYLPQSFPAYGRAWG